MEVAATLGCTVAELGDRMSSEEFGLWLAYRELQPFGPLQLMPMLAEVLAGLANGQSPRKDKRGWRADDFIAPKRWAVPPAPPPANAVLPAVDLSAIGRLFGG